MSLRFIPNLLCVLRIALIYPVAWLIIEQRYATVMLLFAVAALTALAVAVPGAYLLVRTVTARWP
jgi:hypothetical protein